jgi:hypothetical protein
MTPTLTAFAESMPPPFPRVSFLKMPMCGGPGENSPDACADGQCPSRLDRISPSTATSSSNYRSWCVSRCIAV